MGMPHLSGFTVPQQPGFGVQQPGFGVQSSIVPPSGLGGSRANAQVSSQADFAGFTEAYTGPAMPQFSGQYSGLSQPQSGFVGVSYSPPVSGTSAQQPWYFDSGATSHITNNFQHMVNPQPAAPQDGIMVGNGSHIQVSHTGTGVLTTPLVNFHLKNLLHTPYITHNLLSVHKFASDNSCYLVLDSYGLTIQDQSTHKILYKGPYHKGLYPLLISSEVSSESSSTTTLVHISSNSAMTWHKKLGHPSSSLLSTLIKQFDLPVTNTQSLDCRCCHMAKSQKLPFTLSETVSSFPFQLVHSDVWGPSPIPSHKGFRYYLLIVDDLTRFTWLFPLHYKSEVKYVIQQFKAFVFTQFHTQIQTFRSDNGGEFINHFLQSLMLDHGIVHQTSCPHTPEQNGVAERKHRHLIETTITLLLQSHLPTSFWLEALTTAVYLTNRLPHTSLNY